MLDYLFDHLFRLRGRQLTHYCLVESVDQHRDGIGHQRYRARLSWLESHCRACRYIEAIPKRSLSIKGQGAICFCKMIVTADLYRSIARVRNSQRNCLAATIQNDLSRRMKNLSRNHSLAP